MDQLPKSGPMPAYSPPEHQRQIDAIQAAIRSGAGTGAGNARPSLFRPPPPRPAPSTDQLDHRISEELEFIVRQLEQLGGSLTNDPILLHRHSAELQSIDLMKQLLRHLAQVIAAQDKAHAAELVTLTALKARLQRKPLRPIGEVQSAS
jgi:hypothetical protein